jgi:triacylglycerol esterase/lipase EstA (alpha/beta hydrolase family)
MILVGHSMGGLVSRMLTVDSGDEFWSIVSDEPIDSIKGDKETVEHLQHLFFFTPEPSISRVITIASPHEGSKFANNATRWLSHKAFTLPQMFQSGFNQFVQENKGVLRNKKHLMVPTSIDSLSPDSPFISRLQQAKRSDRVKYHNIYGNVVHSGFLEKVGLQSDTQSDGVVSVESAKLDDVNSQLEVNAEHMTVHQHPKTILEVKRILIDNLIELGRIDPRENWIAPASYQSTTETPAQPLMPIPSTALDEQEGSIQPRPVSK